MFVLDPGRISELARRLESAERNAAGIEPLTAELPSLEVEQAYAVQAELLRLKREKGERIIGYKMGLTSKAKMEQMGVHAPIYGVLTDRMFRPDGAEFALAGSIHPRIEPEIAFRLGRELKGRPSPEEALAACSNACAALEIIDSRYKAFRFKLSDVVADNASCKAFALGTWQPVPALERLGSLSMELRVGGKAVRNGSSSHILGNPARSLATLAGMLSDRGLSLAKGAVVLAGAATEAVALEEGACVEADVEELGRVAVSAR